MNKIFNNLMMLIAISMLSFHAHAQINYPVTQWLQKSYDAGGTDFGNGIATNAAGDSYVMGFISSEFNIPGNSFLNVTQKKNRC